MEDIRAIVLSHSNVTMTYHHLELESLKSVISQAEKTQLLLTSRIKNMTQIYYGVTLITLIPVIIVHIPSKC